MGGGVGRNAIKRRGTLSYCNQHWVRTYTTTTVAGRPNLAPSLPLNKMLTRGTFLNSPEYYQINLLQHVIGVTGTDALLYQTTQFFLRHIHRDEWGLSHDDGLLQTSFQMDERTNCVTDIIDGTDLIQTSSLQSFNNQKLSWEHFNIIFSLVIPESRGDFSLMRRRHTQGPAGLAHVEYMEH